MILLVLCLAFLIYAIICLYEFISASLRDLISNKRMEKRGCVRKLVSREDESPWVDDDDVVVDVDADFREGGKRAKRKRLDKELRPELDRPTIEELDLLREKLQIASGCMCFKHGAVYVVTCEGKKRRWKRLGCWETLRDECTRQLNTK